MNQIKIKFYLPLTINKCFEAKMTNMNEIKEKNKKFNQNLLKSTTSQINQKFILDIEKLKKLYFNNFIEVPTKNENSIKFAGVYEIKNEEFILTFKIRNRDIVNFKIKYSNKKLEVIGRTYLETMDFLFRI